MSEHRDHEKIIQNAAEQFKVVLTGSKDSVYIYLDDTHKLANRNFTDLLEYESQEEWAAVENPFTLEFVEEKSQHVLVHAYSHAMEEKAASKIQVSWKTKSGKIVNTNVIIAPISIMGEILAIHFIEKI